MERGLSDSDAVFDLLANRRRRRALTVLEADDRRLTVHDLTRELAVAEAGPHTTDVPGETVQRIFVSLRHVHLPKLAALELVKYDRDRGLVEPTDRLAGLEPHFSVVSETDSEPRFEHEDV